MYDLKLLNGSCYVDDEFVKANIYINKGKIAKISNAVLPASNSYDCHDMLVIPGLIDPHVHLDLDLGEFKSVDDFESGTKAAAFGGITTIIDFLDPIFKNSDYDEVFKRRMNQASKSHLDYAFHCTLGNYKDSTLDLFELLKRDFITSIKVFTAYSESNRKCSYDVIEELLSSKLTVLSHSEEDGLVDNSYEDVKSYESSRPENSEITAVRKLSEIVKKTNGKLYIVHTSSGNTIKMLNENYSSLISSNIFIESCPQYFYLDNSRFKDEDGRKYLLAPPLRSKETVEVLKEYIDKIDTIATDHCPFMLEEKLRYLDANKIPKGIGGVEYSFVLMYEMFGDKIINKFTKTPARIFDLKNKGQLKVGYDADICIFDPNGSTIVTSGHSKSDYSVYENLRLKGKMISTISRGNFIVKNGDFVGGYGKYIRREI